MAVFCVFSFSLPVPPSRPFQDGKAVELPKRGSQCLAKVTIPADNNSCPASPFPITAPLPNISCDQEITQAITRMLENTDHPSEALKAFQALLSNPNFELEDFPAGHLPEIFASIVINHQFTAEAKEDSKETNARLDFIYAWLENHEKPTSISVSALNTDFLDFGTIDAFAIYNLTQLERISILELWTLAIKKSKGKALATSDLFIGCWEKIKLKCPAESEESRLIRLEILTNTINKSDDCIAALKQLELILCREDCTYALLQKINAELAPASNALEVLLKYT